MSGRDVRNRDDRPDRRRRRERDRGDRDRDFERPSRDRDDRSLATANPLAGVSGPVVILKRPGSHLPTSASQSQPQLSQTQNVSKEKDLSGNAAGDSTANESLKSTPTVILQRSIQLKRNTDSNQDIHGAASQHEPSAEKLKPSAPLTLFDVLKPPYKFKFENAVTVIDRNMKIKTLNDFDFFSNGKNNPDFFVITTVGKPLTGKSTILSYLATDERFGCGQVFQSRNRDQEMESSIYISSDHVIFIEIASLFNCAAAHDLITCAAQHGTLETTALTWNLRLMRWALSVSHVVLVVSDSLCDPNLFQLINSAEMIHPMESALGEGTYPELLFVCNKAPLSYLDDEKVQSQFQFMFSTVTGRPPRIHPNFYILPHSKWGCDLERYEELKTKIYEFNRYNRAPFAVEEDNLTKIPQKYSVYEWYCNASRLWDEMNHPNFFSSYVKLLP